MKNLIFALLAFSSVTAFADVRSDVAKVAAQTKKCLSTSEGQSTYGMNSCFDQGYQAADRILNQYYKAVVTNLKTKTGDEEADAINAETLQRLVKAQRAWIAFRDSNSLLKGVSMLGGSGEGPLENAAVYEMTKSRVLELAEVGL